MRKVKTLSIVITVYNGIIGLLLLAFGAFIGFIGGSVMNDAKAMSGEVFAGAFALILAIVAIVVAAANIVPFVTGIVANVKAKKLKADEQAFIKKYSGDSTAKVIVNGFFAASSIYGFINNIASGDIEFAFTSLVPIVMGALSLWYCIEVSRNSKKAA